MGDHTDAALKKGFAEEKRAKLYLAILFGLPLLVSMYWHSELGHYKLYPVALLLNIVGFFFSIYCLDGRLKLVSKGQEQFSVSVLKQLAKDKRVKEEMKKLREELEKE